MGMTVFRAARSGAFLVAALVLWCSPGFGGLGVHNALLLSRYPGGPCGECHIVQAASRGWARARAAAAAGWYTQPISLICWTCHSSGNTVGAHDVTTTALNARNHGHAVALVPPLPAMPLVRDDAPVRRSGLPHTSGASLQCTSCHEVHNDQYRPFMRQPEIRTLCDTCHARRNAAALRAANVGVGADNVSVHPVNVAMASTTGASSIKTVETMAPALKVAYVAPPGYVLGGKLTAGATGNLSCETCHAVHGTNALGGVNDLLAIDNRSGDAAAPGSALCEGCHYGGAAGGSAGAAGTSDHPVDNNVGRAFYPAGVALPPVWTQAAPRLDRGAAVFTTAGGVTGSPRCSSCHDAHGGLGGTSLLRSPVPAAASGQWCLACHTATQTAPQAHHSARGLEAGLFTSSIGCGACHGAGWVGHNGFFAAYTTPAAAFTTPRGRAVAVADVATNRDSALCIYCHNDDDPLNWRSDNTVMNPMPRGHGTRRGGGSHYLGIDTSLTISGSSAPVDAILFVGSWAADNAAYSKYGNATGGGNVPAVVTGASTVICESCHSISFNEGAIHPALYVNRTTAGWWTNLLLKPYEDDPSGIGTGLNEYAVGSELCLGCHAEPPPKHHPTTGDTLTSGPRTGSPLITGPSSYASKATAPGTLSYPAANRMDCDSCHRAHSADSDSTVVGSTRYSRTPVYLLLEVDSPGNNWATSLCGECHPQ